MEVTMTRISKKKRRRRVSTNKINYVIGIILIVVVIILIINSFKSEDDLILEGDEVLIKNLEFLGVGEDHYIKFKIMNPTDELKTCLLNMTLTNEEFSGRKQYLGSVDVDAKSNKPHTILVDMPNGTTDIRLDYTC